jgi:hypothetical protein
MPFPMGVSLINTRLLLALYLILKHDQANVYFPWLTVYGKELMMNGCISLTLITTSSSTTHPYWFCKKHIPSVLGHSSSNGPGVCVCAKTLDDRGLLWLNAVVPFPPSPGPVLDQSDSSEH